MSDSKTKIVFLGFALWIFTVAIYIVLATNFFSDFQPSNFPYFTLLAESFLHRRYDLIHPPANPFDLSFYKGAVYLPWGPIPALLLMPVVKLFGIGVSDKMYTAIFGAFNVILFYFVLLGWNRVRKKYSFWQPIFLTLFFAFGTVQFSVSTKSQVWFTSQVLSLTPFLISLLFLFRSIEKKSFTFFVYSLVLFTLAFMGKIWYIAMIPTYIYGYWVSHFSIKEHMRAISIGFLLIVFLGRTYGMYNYRRFGSIWETGYSYQRQAENFEKLGQTFGRYHIRYIKTNLWYEFINPVMTVKGFQPDPYGNGLFTTSPLFLLLFLLPFIKKIGKQVLLIGPSIALYTLFVIGFFGTGYFQFGHRYLLEIIPFLILLLSLVIPFVPKRIPILLGIISMVFNSFGAYWLVTR